MTKFRNKIITVYCQVIGEFINCLFLQPEMKTIIVFIYKYFLCFDTNNCINQISSSLDWDNYH